MYKKRSKTDRVFEMLVQIYKKSSRINVAQVRCFSNEQQNQMKRVQISIKNFTIYMCVSLYFKQSFSSFQFVCSKNLLQKLKISYKISSFLYFYFFSSQNPFFNLFFYLLIDQYLHVDIFYDLYHFMIIVSFLFYPHLDNKYNMLDTVPLRTHRFAQIHQKSSAPPIHKDTNYPRHIINLDLTPASPLKRTLDPDFKTFYNNTSRSWRVSHLRGQHGQSGRNSAATERHSVVGTPYVNRGIEKDTGNTIMPLFDGQHYHYLVKAIASIKKGRLLSELRYSQTLNPEGKYEKNQIKLQPMTQSLFQSSPEHKGGLGSPRVVNISAKLGTRRGNRRAQQSNSFQKVFKNKQKLQNKYFQGKDEGDKFQLRLLGDDQLSIHQVGWARHNKSPPVHQ